MQQEKWDEAIKAFRAAAEKDPEMSEAWYGIGVAENMKNGGSCEAAYKPLKRCVDLDPNHARAHCLLGGVLLHVRKDAARAEKHFRATIRLEPNYALPHRGLSFILERRDDLDGAIREMLDYTRKGDPGGDGKATVAELRAKKAGLAAKPNAEAKARSPSRRARATAACDLVRLDPF